MKIQAHKGSGYPYITLSSSPVAEPQDDSSGSLRWIKGYVAIGIPVQQDFEGDWMSTTYIEAVDLAESLRELGWTVELPV